MVRKTQSSFEKLSAAMSRTSPEDEEWLDLLARKLEPLVQKYNTRPDDPGIWFRLALGLADDYVNGFAESKVGRPATRFDDSAIEARRKLLTYVESKTPQTITAVCTRLARTRTDLPPYNRDRKELSLHTLKAEVTLAKKERQRAANIRKLALAMGIPYDTVHGDATEEG